MVHDARVNLFDAKGAVRGLEHVCTVHSVCANWHKYCLITADNPLSNPPNYRSI